MLHNTESLRRQGPNQFLKTDMMCIHRGMDGWCYYFNVLDIFTRHQVAHIFDLISTAYTAIQLILKTVLCVGKNILKLRLKTDSSLLYDITSLEH